jgi:hypothetical protein
MTWSGGRRPPILRLRTCPNPLLRTGSAAGRTARIAARGERQQNEGKASPRKSSPRRSGSVRRIRQPVEPSAGAHTCEKRAEKGKNCKHVRNLIRTIT